MALAFAAAALTRDRAAAEAPDFREPHCHCRIASHGDANWSLKFGN